MNRQAEAELSGIPSEDRGYLDIGTAPLYYTGATSLGGNHFQRATK